MINFGKVLLVGAHPDDLEFGMGGLMNQLPRENTQVLVVSNSENINGPQIKNEFLSSVQLFGFSAYLGAKVETMHFHKYESEIKQLLFDHKKPDTIFCPSIRSHNRDHQVLAECVRNVFQEQAVIYYEIMRGDYDHRPNLWITLQKEDLEMKIKALGCYNTQKKRHYSSFDKIEAMARFRGAQIGTEFAESFEVVRLIG